MYVQQSCCIQRHHSYRACCTLAAHVLSALLNSYVCSDKLSERDHQHLLSPQSWIWVFSCSVSQENRADLPSSSSYFRSLTKCCKNRHVNSDLHSEQKTVWMVKELINIKVHFKAQRILDPALFTRSLCRTKLFSLPYQIMSHSPVMGGSLPHLGRGSFQWRIHVWSLNLKLSGLLAESKWHTKSKTPHCYT